MNDEFAKRIYNVIVENGMCTYYELFENTELNSKTINYWKNALNLYNALDDDQKSIFMAIIKQTIIDTISGVMGVLDGSSTLPGEEIVVNVTLNGDPAESELQDSFLMFVEEKCKK